MLYNLGYALPGLKAVHAGGDNDLPYLGGVLASSCCDLDATIEASYSGSGQTWANLIASPADGAVQADYDFYLGEDGSSAADDPAFTGSAGDQAACFSFDGGDNFNIRNFPAAATLYNAHKTGTGAVTDWWIACAFASPAATKKALWGASWTANDYGIYWWVADDDAYFLRGATGINMGAGWAYAPNTPQLAILTMDTANNVTRFWLNNREKTIDNPAFGNFALDANRTFRIGAAADDAGPVGRMAAGAKIYAFSCGNAFIDDAEAGLLFDEYNARHGRIYA